MAPKRNTTNRSGSASNESSISTRLFRVYGLQSQRGKAMNGMLCTSHGDPEREEERVSCWIDGEPEMVAVKKTNLMCIDTNSSQMETFRISLKCRNASELGPLKFGLLELIRESDGQSFDFSTLPWIQEKYSVDGDYRTTAIPSLLPLLKSNFLANTHRTNYVLIKCDCLCTCRTINYHSVKMPNSITIKEWDILDEASGNRRLTFFASFQPYRSQLVVPEFPLKRTDSWQRRLQAAEKGLFQMYPCPCPGFSRFYQEVFYSSLDGTHTYQEIFRVTMFTPSFDCSGENMLDPETLAKSDPQAFWNLVLVLVIEDVVGDKLVDYLNALGVSFMTKFKWRKLSGGIQKSKPAQDGWTRALIENGSIPQPLHCWHEERAPIHAALSLPLKIARNYQSNTQDNDNPIVPPLSSRMVSRMQRDTKHEILPCYYNSAFEEALLCLATDGCADCRTNLFYDPFHNSLKLKCNMCRSSSNNLQECDGCGRVVYCGKECQTLGWSSHRNLCASKRRAATATPSFKS